MVALVGAMLSVSLAQAWLVARIGDATSAALVAGIFLIINSLVTLYVTFRLTHRADERQASPPSHRQDSDSDTDRVSSHRGDGNHRRRRHRKS